MPEKALTLQEYEDRGEQIKAFLLSQPGWTINQAERAVEAYHLGLPEEYADQAVKFIHDNWDEFSAFVLPKQKIVLNEDKQLSEKFFNQLKQRFNVEEFSDTSKYILNRYFRINFPKLPKDDGFLAMAIYTPEVFQDVYLASPMSTAYKDYIDLKTGEKMSPIKFKEIKTGKQKYGTPKADEIIELRRIERMKTTMTKLLSKLATIYTLHGDEPEVREAARQFETLTGLDLFEVLSADKVLSVMPKNIIDPITGKPRPFIKKNKFDRMVAYFTVEEMFRRRRFKQKLVEKYGSKEAAAQAIERMRDDYRIEIERGLSDREKAFWKKWREYKKRAAASSTTMVGGSGLAAMGGAIGGAVAAKVYSREETERLLVGLIEDEIKLQLGSDYKKKLLEIKAQQDKRLSELIREEKEKFWKESLPGESAIERWAAESTVTEAKARKRLREEILAKQKTDFVSPELYAFEGVPGELVDYIYEIDSSGPLAETVKQVATKIGLPVLETIGEGFQHVAQFILRPAYNYIYEHVYPDVVEKVKRDMLAKFKAEYGETEGIKKYNEAMEDFTFKAPTTDKELVWGLDMVDMTLNWCNKERIKAGLPPIDDIGPRWLYALLVDIFANPLSYIILPASAGENLTIRAPELIKDGLRAAGLRGAVFTKLYNKARPLWVKYIKEMNKIADTSELAVLEDNFLFGFVQKQMELTLRFGEDMANILKGILLEAGYTENIDAAVKAVTGKWAKYLKTYGNRSAYLTAPIPGVGTYELLTPPQLAYLAEPINRVWRAMDKIPVLRAVKAKAEVAGKGVSGFAKQVFTPYGELGMEHLGPEMEKYGKILGPKSMHNMFYSFIEEGKAAIRSRAMVHGDILRRNIDDALADIAEAYTVKTGKKLTKEEREQIQVGLSELAATAVERPNMLVINSENLRFHAHAEVDAPHVMSRWITEQVDGVADELLEKYYPVDLVKKAKETARKTGGTNVFGNQYEAARYQLNKRLAALNDLATSAPENMQSFIAGEIAETKEMIRNLYFLEELKVPIIKAEGPIKGIRYQRKKTLSPKQKIEKLRKELVLPRGAIKESARAPGGLPDWDRLAKPGNMLIEFSENPRFNGRVWHVEKVIKNKEGVGDALKVFTLDTDSGVLTRRVIPRGRPLDRFLGFNRRPLSETEMIEESLITKGGEEIIRVPTKKEIEEEAVRRIEISNVVQGGEYSVSKEEQFTREIIEKLNGVPEIGGPEFTDIFIKVTDRYPYIKELVNNTEQWLRDRMVSEMTRGILKKARNNYLPLIPDFAAAPPRKAWEEISDALFSKDYERTKRLLRARGLTRPRYDRFFTKPRTYKNIEEAAREGVKMIKRLEFIIPAREVASFRAIVNDHILKAAVKYYGKMTKEGVKFDPEIARYVERLTRLSYEDDVAKYLLGLHDFTLSFYKGLQTVRNFPFHQLRNRFGDTFLMWLAGKDTPAFFIESAYVLELPRLRELVAYEAMKNTEHAVEYLNKYKALRKAWGSKYIVVKTTGEKVTYKQLAVELERLGVIDSGMIGADTSAYMKEIYQQAMGPKFDLGSLSSWWKTTKDRSPAVKGYRRMIGQQKGLTVYMENHGRAEFYMWLRQQGKTPTQAAQITKEVLFDYSAAGASRVEQEVFKRVFPFWTFFKNAFTKMPIEAIYNPGKVARGALFYREKWVDFLEENPDFDADNINQYMWNMVPVPMWVDPESPTGIDPLSSKMPSEKATPAMFSADLPIYAGLLGPGVGPGSSMESGGVLGAVLDQLSPWAFAGLWGKTLGSDKGYDVFREQEYFKEDQVRMPSFLQALDSVNPGLLDLFTFEDKDGHEYSLFARVQDPETGEVYRVMPKWMLKAMTSFAPINSLTRLFGLANKADIFQILAGQVNPMEKQALEVMQDFWLQALTLAGVRIKKQNEIGNFNRALHELANTVDELARTRIRTMNISAITGLEKTDQETLENLKLLEELLKKTGAKTTE